MSKLQSFLEQLVGAGIVPSADQLGEEQKRVIQTFLEQEEAERQKLQKERDDLDRRVRGQDAKISGYDNEIRELRLRLGQDAGPDALGRLKTEMHETYGSKLEELLAIVKGQQAELASAQARIARGDAIAKLAEQYPILKDPKYHAMLPETPDEAALSERAKLLMALKEETERVTVEQIRAGYVPATAPPRVIPGNVDTFDREIQSIAARRDSGAISPQQAKLEMDTVMKAFAQRS